MSSTARRAGVRIGSPAGMLAVVPHLLGFTPDSSLVVIGLTRWPQDHLASLRYDLPDPPDAGLVS